MNTETTPAPKEWTLLSQQEPAPDQPIYAELDAGTPYPGSEVAGIYFGDGIVKFDFYSGTGSGSFSKWKPRTPTGEPGHPWTSIERGAPKEVPQPASGDKRAKFEAWATAPERQLPIERHPLGQRTYADPRTAWAWSAWQDSPLAASGAPQEAPGDAPSDSQMLDWLAEQWRDGLHLEACATGGPTIHGLRAASTIYVGNQRFDANTPREAIRAAMKGPQ